MIRYCKNLAEQSLAGACTIYNKQYIRTTSGYIFPIMHDFSNTHKNLILGYAEVCVHNIMSEICPY